MKRDKKFEDWEKSIDGILYSLKSIGNASIEDEKNNFLIAKVLQKLPEKVREKVLDEVFFIHTTAYGTVTLLDFQKFIKETEIQKIRNNAILSKEKSKDTDIAHRHLVTYEKGNGLIKSGFFVRIPQVFIIFNFKCIRSAETKMNTIAHEIAHFINKPKDSCKTRLANIEEKEADDLAEKWGFERSYKSYKKFKGAFSGIG